MKSLVLVAVLALSGCSTFQDPTVFLDSAGNIITGLTGETTNKQGLTSRDAAYVQTTKSYHKAKADQKERKYVEIKAAPGKTIENLESVTVYAPPAPGETHIAQPEVPKSGAVAIIEATGKAVKDVAGAVLPFEIVAKGTEVIKDTNATNLEAERIRADERQATTGQAIEAASKPPVIVPQYAAPAVSAE